MAFPGRVQVQPKMSMWGLIATVTCVTLLAAWLVWDVYKSIKEPLRVPAKPNAVRAVPGKQLPAPVGKIERDATRIMHGDLLGASPQAAPAVVIRESHEVAPRRDNPSNNAGASPDSYYQERR